MVLLRLKTAPGQSSATSPGPTSAAVMSASVPEDMQPAAEAGEVVGPNQVRPVTAMPRTVPITRAERRRVRGVPAEPRRPSRLPLTAPLTPTARHPAASRDRRDSGRSFICFLRHEQDSIHAKRRGTSEFPCRRTANFPRPHARAVIRRRTRPRPRRRTRGKQSRSYRAESRRGRAACHAGIPMVVAARRLRTSGHRGRHPHPGEPEACRRAGRGTPGRCSPGTEPSRRRRR